MAAATHNSPAGTAPPQPATRLFSSVLGVASVVVLLQAVWAGVFIREGHRDNGSWVTVHARGADIAIALAVVAAGVAMVKLRDRRDLVIGSVVFALLLVLEAFLGGLVGKHPPVQEVHFPLGMALMGLAVWLPLRARHAVGT